jgi:hypothetical protein
MTELTLERNPIDVRNVGNCMLIPVTFVIMKDLTVEKNPMNVSNVGKPSISALTFQCIEEPTHK